MFNRPPHLATVWGRGLVTRKLGPGELVYLNQTVWFSRRRLLTRLAGRLMSHVFEGLATVAVIARHEVCPHAEFTTQECPVRLSNIGPDSS